MLDIAKRKRRGHITQSNTLIRNRHHLNLMEVRLLYVAFEAVKYGDQSFDFLEFPEPVLRDLLSGYYGSFKEDLRNSAHRLAGTTIELWDEGSWYVIPLFSGIEWVEAGKKSKATGKTNQNATDTIYLRLHDDLKPHLIDLEGHYNSQKLTYILSIPRLRSQRLFEVLHHESWQGQKAEVIIERDLLSEFLHIQGKYDKFRDYRRVLDTCLKHIEEHTDMRLSYTGIREGRKITKLQFHVWYEKNSQNTIFSDSKEKNMEVLFVMNELSSAGYTQDPQKTIETYGIDKVKQAIRQARSAERKSATSKNPIYNLGGLIAHLLLQPLTSQHESPDVIEDYYETARHIQEAYDELVLANYEDHWQSLGKEQQLSVKRTLLERANSFERKRLEKDGEHSASFMTARNKVLHDNIKWPEHLASVNDYLLTLDHDEDALEPIKVYFESFKSS